eukprot:2211693-Amphidinium_carterae.1
MSGISKFWDMWVWSAMHMQPHALHATAALEDTFATQSRSLYFLLIQLVSGRAFVTESSTRPTRAPVMTKA